MGRWKPAKVVSLVDILGTPSGTTLPIRRTSLSTALVYGMFSLSAIMGWRDWPITVSISSCTFSMERKKKIIKKICVQKLSSKKPGARACPACGRAGNDFIF